MAKTNIPAKSGLNPNSRQFGDRLSWSNGHPNQRNAKTSVEASGENCVKQKAGSRVQKKPCM